MIGNPAIFNWSIDYEQQYLEEVLSHFQGVGSEDEIHRSTRLFSSPGEFLRLYVVSLKQRVVGFTGEGRMEESERAKIGEHVRQLIERAGPSSGFQVQEAETLNLQTAGG